MTSAKLRALFSAGLTYDEIAEVNERSEGWKPSRSAVLRKYQDMGMPPRRASSHDLIPWRVTQEHSDSLVRHMLSAESRSRQHKALSPTDRKLVARLHETLFGRGMLMVVDYHPEAGFSFVLRDDSDGDIIRPPRSVSLLRKDLAAAVRDAEDEPLALLAQRAGLSPELLENASRDRAADILRNLSAGAPRTHQDQEHDDTGTAAPPVAVSVPVVTMPLRGNGTRQR